VDILELVPYARNRILDVDLGQIAVTVGIPGKLLDESKL